MHFILTANLNLLIREECFIFYVNADYAYLEEQERKERRKAWMDLKKLRDNGMISKEDFKKRKAEIFE